MQKFLRTLTLMALLFVPWVMQGQNAAKVSEYDGEVTRAAYTSIASPANAVALTNGTATVTMDFAMPLGESNVASGTNVTVHGNGYIQFAGLATSGVAPLWFADYSSGSVYYTHSSTEMVFEWRKVVDGTNSYSFQLALYPSGDIQFRYGPMTLNATKSVTVGLMSSNTDIFRVNTVSSRWDTVVRATNMATRSITYADYYNASHMAYNQATGEGVVYTFTQPACVKPAFPSSNALVASTWDTIKITWNAFEGATKYEVFYTDNANMVPSETTTGTIVTASTPKVQLTNGDITGYRLGGLNYNTTYYVYVRKYCGTTPSGWAVAGNAKTANITTSNFTLSNAGVASWTLTNYPTVDAVQLYYTKTQAANVAALLNAAPQVTVLKSDSLKYDIALRQTLESATKYYVYYRLRYTQGGTTKYAWVDLTGSSSRNFTTPCGAITVTNGNPYVEGFEDYEGTTYSSNGVIPTCWESYATGSIYPHVIGSGSYWYKHNGTKALTFYGSGYCYATLPEFSNALNTLQISFWYQQESASYGTLTLGYITAEDNNMSTFTAIKTFPSKSSMTEVSDEILASVPATATRLVFRWYSSSQWSCCIDDVVVSIIPTCPKPTNFAVTSAGVATWTASDNADHYQVYVGSATATEPVAADAIDFASGNTLPGLAPNTSYKVWLRAYCSPTDQSIWVGPVEFTTPCMAITVDGSHPYSVDFTANSEMPECWSQTTGNKIWGFENNIALVQGDGSNYSSATSTKLVSPIFELGTDVYWLGFTGELYKGYGYGSSSSYLTKLRVYYRTSVDGNWTELTDAYRATSSYGTESMELNEEGITLPVGTVQIAFEASVYDYYYYNSYAALTGMSIVKAPSCIKPTIISAVPGTGDNATSVVLSWQENSATPATSWEVMYSNGTDTMSVIADNNTAFTLGYLEVGTAYTWKVRSLCSTDDQSDWSNEGSFTTNCISGGDVSLGEHTGTSNYLPMNACYDYALSQQIYTPAELGGGKTIESLSYNVTTANSVNQTDVDVYFVESDVTSFASVSDMVSISSLTPVYSGTFITTQTGWHTITLTTPFEYSGEHNLIVVIDNNTGEYSCTPYFGTIAATGNQAVYAYQDNTDITVDNVSSVSSYQKGVLSVKNNFIFGSPCGLSDCEPPTLATEISQSGDFATATLTFTPSGEATDLYYKYGVSGFDVASATEHAVNANSAVLENLSGSTTYDIYVYAKCSGTAGRMTRYQFTTPFIPTCKLQTNFDTNAVSYNGATVVWEQADPNQVPEKWIVRWNTTYFNPATAAAADYTEVEVTTASLALTGLHNGDSVYFYTKADCGTDGESPNWSKYTFQMPIVLAPMGVTSFYTSNISDSLRWNDQNGTVAGTLPVSSWTVRYATADFDPTDDNANFETLEANNDTVKLANLESSTKYYVYVRANGSATEHSPWTPVHTFTTLCPYTEQITLGNYYSSSSSYPIYNSYSYLSRSQQIFTVEEMGGAAATLNNIAYNVASTNATTNPTVKVYLAEADIESFVYSSDSVSVSDMTLVYNGTMPVTETGWQKLDFAAPFQYSGTKNLIVHMETPQGTGSYVYFGYGPSQSTYKNFYTYYYNSSSKNAYVAYSRPLYAFNYGLCDATVTCFAPTAVKAEKDTKDSTDLVTLSWTRATLEPATTNYQVAYGEEGFADGLDADQIAAAAQGTRNISGKDSAFFNSADLQPATPYDFYVRGNCGEGNYSPNWVKATLTTYPAVFAPKNVVASAPTTSSMKLSWTELNKPAATTWEIAYGPKGFVLGEDADTSATTNTNFEVTGLKHSTTYEFYVRAVKGNVVSPWSEVPGTGTTDCGVWTVADLPLNEGFDNITTGIPECWDNSEGSTTDASYKWNYYATGNNGHALRFNSYSNSNGKTNYLKTPAVKVTDNIVLSFNYKNPTGGDFSVYVSKDGGTTKSPLATGLTSQTTWAPMSFTLEKEQYSGDTVNFYFKGTSNYGNGDAYIYLDDVVIKVLEPTDTLPNTNDSREVCEKYIVPTLDDNGGYTADGTYTYTLTAPAGKVLHITGSYDLEYGYDYLSLYRGSVAPANLIGTYTGTGNDIDFKTKSNLWADSGSVVLVFSTDDDNSLPYQGFKFLVQCECPDMPDTVQQVVIDTNTLFAWTSPEGNGKTYEKHSTNRSLTAPLVVDLVDKAAYIQKNIGGCDSIAKELHLTVHPDFLIKDTIDICDRDTLDYYGERYTVQGDYVDTLKSIHGADSIGWLHLIVHEAPVAYIYNDNKQLGATVAGWCDNQEMTLEGRSNVTSTFKWMDTIDGALYTVTPHLTGTYTVVATDNTYGCTSLPVSVTVTTTPVAEFTIAATDSAICQGESTTMTIVSSNNTAATYRWMRGATLVGTGDTLTVTPDSTTTYTVTATTASESKCQTTATFTVVVNPLPEVALTSAANSCRDSAVLLAATPVPGYAYLWDNADTTATTVVYPTATGTYNVTVTVKATGCAKEFTTNAITVFPSYTVADTMTVCFTQNPYTWGTQTLTEDGDYTQNFKIANNCDSLVNVNFSFKDMSTINVRRELCEGAAYTWGGTAYTANADTTVHYVSTPLDCPVDSVLMLTVNHPAASSFDKTVCDGYTWVIAGDTIGTYGISGAYIADLKTNKGCDSTVTMNLTVNYQNAATDVQNVCDELEWIDGNLYTSDTNGALFTLKNVYGCDSLVVLDLTLRHSTEGDTLVQVCDSRSFTWTANDSVIGTYNLTDVSGNIRATFAGEAANGCDTTAILRLTMNYVADTLPWVNVSVRDVFYLTTVECDGLTTTEVEKEYRASGDIEERIHNDELNRDQWYRAHLTVNTSVNHTDRRTECVPYVFGLIHYMDTVSGEHFVVNKDDYVAGANDSLILLTLEDKSKGFHYVGTYDTDAYVSFNLDELGYGEGADTSVIWRLRLTAKQPAVKVMLDTVCYNKTWTSPENEDFDAKTANWKVGENLLVWKTVDGAAANDCDSIYKVNLLVNPIYNEFVDTTLCESEFKLNTTTSQYEYVVEKLNVNDTDAVVVLTIPGALTDTYVNDVTSSWKTLAGCDSIVTVNYTVHPTVRETVYDTACHEYVWKGHDSFKPLTKSDTYVDTIESKVYGCDSIVTLELTIYDTVKYYDTNTVCYEYVGPDGETYRVTKTFEELVGTSKFGCDTLRYTTFVVQGIYSVTQNVITNDSAYKWAQGNGQTYTENVSNVLFDAGKTIYGCDSVMYLNLTFADTINPCRNELPFATGIGTFTVTEANAAAGEYNNYVRVKDTVFDTILIYAVRDTAAFEDDSTFCDSWTWNGQTYTTSGDYTYTTTAANGCDSVTTIHLTINKSTDSVMIATKCDSMFWNNKWYYATIKDTIDTTTTGTPLKNAVGCDSIAVLDLTINKNTKQVKTQDVCINADYAWKVSNNAANDTLMTFAANSLAAGEYAYGVLVTDANGCDVIDSLYLTVNSILHGDRDSVVNAPAAYYKENLYMAPFNSDTLSDLAEHMRFVDTLTAIGGCDSVVTTHFLVEVGTIVNDEVFSCGLYTWRNGHTYEWIPASERVNPLFAYKDITTDSYIYENPMYSTFVNDTIDKTYVLWLNMGEATIAHMTYAQFPLSQDSLTIGDSTFNFSSYKSFKKDTVAQREVRFGSTYYCDSIEYWTINLKYNYDTVDTTYLCYTDPKAAGKDVDKVFLLNDTTAKGTTDEMVITTKYIRMPQIIDGIVKDTACDKYAWFDSTYVASTDSATHTLQVTHNGVTCDSIVVLNLVINKSTTGDTTAVACEKFTWYDSTYTVTPATAPTHVYTNAVGCDSTVTLNLTINYAVNGTQVAIACDSLKWYDSVYTVNTDSATHTLPGAAVNGCDSIVTLNLTLNHPTSGDTTAVACDSFDWYEYTGLTKSVDTLKHNFVGGDVNGCDSIVTLHLTVNKSSKPTDDTIQYRGGSYRLNGKLYIAPVNDTIVDSVFTNVAGCDSLVHIHLWVNPYEIEYDNVVACGLYTWSVTGHTYQWISDEERAAHGNALYKDITDDSYVMTYPFDTVDIALRYLNLTLNESAFGDTTVARFPLSQDSLRLGDSTFYFSAFKADKKDTTVNVWYSAGHNYYCDSLVYATINLVYDYDTVNENVCYAVDTLQWHGKEFPMPTAPQTYTFTDTVDAGMPSEQVSTKIVYRRALVASAFDTTVCDSVRWTFVNDLNKWDTLIVDGGAYVHAFTDVNGCDSTVTMTVNMFHDLSTAYYDTVCDKTTWNEKTYTASGTYYYNYKSDDAGKCASVDTLYLIVNHNNGQNDSMVACDNYKWHGTEYTTSGTYKFDSIDENGCKHMDTLWLTINNSHVHDSVIWAGEGSYRYKGVMYTADTNFFDTLDIQTTKGCDSIWHVTIHIGLNYYATDDTVVCSEYTWRNGHTYQWISTEERTAHNALYKDATTGEYVTYRPTYIKHNDGDYDSIFTLNLMLTQRYNGVDDTVFFVSNDSLIYGDSTFYFTEQNNRAYNVLGFEDSTFILNVTYTQPVVKHYCDSVIALTVTLKNNYVSTGDLHICDVPTFTWKGNTYDSGAKKHGNYDVAYDWYLYDTIAATGMIEYVHVYQHPVAYTTDRRTVCDSIRWIDGNLYTESRSDITAWLHTDSTRGYCDSVVSLVLTVKKGDGKLTEINVAGNDLCGDYTWKRGDSTTVVYTTTQEMLTYEYTNSKNQCPAVDTLNFIYHPIYDKVTATDTACDEYFWDWGNGDTTITKSGVYTHEFSSQYGCDSVVTLTLTVNHNSNMAYYDTTYFGDTYVWNGRNYTEGTATGVATDTFSYYTLSGCKSVDTLYLHMEKGTVTDHSGSNFVCDSITWHKRLYTVADTTDAIVDTFFAFNETKGGKNLSQDTLLLTIHESTHDTTSYAACVSYEWNGTIYTNHHDEVLDTLVTHMRMGVVNEAGCPIYDHLNLRLGTGRTFVFDTVTNCGPYVWTVNGNVIDTLTESIETTADVPTATGCDSVVNLVLTVKYAPVVDTFATVCDSYTWRGMTLTETGDTSVTFAQPNGCDSTITLHLTVNNSTTTKIADNVCLGNGYKAHGFDIAAEELSESKVYTFVEKLQTIHGCDSVVTLTLTVDTILTGDTTAVACDNFFWNGEVYDSTGKYTYKTVTLGGCDSIVNLNLTINYNSSKAESAVACDSYMWHDSVYTEAGDHLFAYTDDNECASVDTLHLTLNSAVTGDTTAVACSYFVWNGQTFSQSGDYTNTLESVAGCDSVVTLHLTINTPVTTTIDTAVCGSFEWNGAEYLQSGVYNSVFPAANGCDSTVTVNLTVKQNVVETIIHTACDSYTWNGNVYTESGVYDTTTTGANGCDSTTTLMLTVNYNTNSAVVVEACDSYDWNDSTYTESGDYYYEYTATSGCASVDTLHLTINASTHNTAEVEACVSYVWHGETYTTSGDKLYHYTNGAGCASADTLHLTINQPTYGEETYASCSTYVWHGQTCNATGTYRDTLVNAAGCDSIVTLNFTLMDAAYTVVTVEACDSYEWHGTLYTASTNTATYQTTGINGCDSIVTLHLTINASSHNSAVAEACESYVWHGETYTTSGDKLYHYTNAAGCASVDTLHLTINQPTYGEETYASCSTYVWHGQTCNATGTYRDTLVNAAGCDSIVTLNFTLMDAAYTVVTVEACDSYEWHGTLYTASTNTATYQTTAANGCDSIVNLHLTINVSSHNSAEVEACVSYEWHGETYTTSGDKLYHYTNAAGCASVDTLHLTINQPVEVTLIENACSSYEWNGETYTTSGTYIDTTTALNGCDSVTTLVLTINQPVYTNLTVTADGGYNWNGEVLTESGVYTYTTTAANGCDSVVTLTLTVNPLYTVTLVSDNTTMGTVSESGVIVENGYFTAVATPNDGYRFVAWKNGSEIVSTTATYVFQVTEDITLTAVFEENVGIDDVDMDNVTIYSANSTIFVKGVEGQDVHVYDVNGRMMYRELNATENLEFRMTATGVYLVKVGNAPAKRVVVVR